MTVASRDLLATDVRDLAFEWRMKAAERRKVSKVDQAADALDFCAGELEQRVQAIESEPTRLTVEQYAKLAHVDVTPQTVRSWIRAGRLPAIETAKGYRISPDANALPQRRR